MQTTIQKSIALSIKFSVLVALVLLTQQAQAQNVPYRVTGTGDANLNNFTAVGEAVGLHFGRLTFEVFEDDSDTQVASDGSELCLLRVAILVFETSDPDPDTGLVVTTVVDEWEIQGGTKRFRNAAAVPDNNIISTAVTAPYDPNGDVTAIPFVFQKLGRIDLGRRN